MKSNQKIKKVAKILNKNGVIILPTDTVAGICTKPGNEEGIRRIYDIKKRSMDKPLALLVPDIKSVWTWVEETEQIKKRLKKEWPGATTFILNTREEETIGVRMPDCKPVLKIMKLTGPLCATSANVSGENASPGVTNVPRDIKNKVDMVVNFNQDYTGKPSRIIDLSGGEEKLIRN